MDGHYPGGDGNRVVLTMGDGVGHGHGESRSDNDTNPGNLREVPDTCSSEHLLDVGFPNSHSHLVE